jgi:hypothetical protein
MTPPEVAAEVISIPEIPVRPTLKVSFEAALEMVTDA